MANASSETVASGSGAACPEAVKMLDAYDLVAFRKELCTVAADRSDCWELWEESGAMRVDKKTVDHPGSTVLGRAQLTFDYDGPFTKLADFLFRPDTKPLFDEFAEPMEVLFDATPSGAAGVVSRVVHQAYQGRFGFSGRSFLMALTREVSADATSERLVVAMRSISEGADESLVDSLVAKNSSSEIQAAYAASRAKTVRGYLHLAGFVVERPRSGKRVTLTWVFDADIRTKGVPNWVVTRVKIDQLKIVSAIPGTLAAWKPTA